MNNTQHTPGPWLVANNGKAGNTYHIWRNDSAGKGEGNEGYAHIAKHVHGAGNAHLIAAAPAMYEALQIMVRAANVDEIDPLVMFASIERAKEALAQAEGSKP